MNIFPGILLILFVLTACGSGGGTAPPPVPEQLNIAGVVGNLGVFDPSISSQTGSTRLWMSYSSVNTSPNYASTAYWGVSIRLAFSDDNGASWQDAGVAVAPAVERTDFGPMTLPSVSIPANSSGIWQNETSSLVYDPSAAAGERWKLIWHQYLHADQSSLFADYGWIAMKVAATPQGLAAATTVKLFGGAGLQPDNDNPASPVFSPIAATPAIQLNTGITQMPGGADVAELAWCIFAEPGLHATSTALYLGIYCADASTIPATGVITEYVVYFSCNSPCAMTNAAGWKYLGRLLSPSDAADTGTSGDHHFQAPSLVEKNGKTYLIITPVNTSSAERYNGCRVYEFADVNGNLLRRSGGRLVEIARIDGNAGTHHGACETYNALDGGILLSQLGTLGTANAFAIHKSRVSLP